MHPSKRWKRDSTWWRQRFGMESGAQVYFGSCDRGETPPPPTRPTLCLGRLKLYVRKNSLASLPLLCPATCFCLSVRPVCGYEFMPCPGAYISCRLAHRLPLWAAREIWDLTCWHLIWGRTSNQAWWPSTTSQCRFKKKNFACFLVWILEI